MKLLCSSIFVNNQEKAIKFYTSKLGFRIKDDVPLGDYRWIVLVSPDDENGLSLALEPDFLPVTKAYHSVKEPESLIQVENIEHVYTKLINCGIDFKQSPTTVLGTKVAVFDDTCGNLIQIVEV